MRPERITAISASVVEIALDTRWIFLEIETEAGRRGVGEATLSGREAEVLAAVAALAPAGLALPDVDRAELKVHRPTGLPEAAALSALDHALWDVVAQRRQVSLAEALGTPRREQVAVYANINRRTRDRTPAGFAESARDAIAAGHRAIKLAPFDEAAGDAGRSGNFQMLLPGLQRIAAVRAAVGLETAVMVDCHWRLAPAGAQYVIAATAELGVAWIECPLPETSDHIEEIALLRHAANRRGMILAGLETAIGIAGFQPFIAAGAYDVMMPDLKYVGGLVEVLRLAKVLRAAGIGFSPHNPSGPVCHAASLHVSACVEDLYSLETQFDETPAFSEFGGAGLVDVRDGALAVPTGTGLGISLPHEALQARCTATWSTKPAAVH